MRPYINLNGDSRDTVIKDYSNVVMALDNAINVIGGAESLWHGRNTVDNHHLQELRNQLSLNIKTLQQIREQYENDFENIDEPLEYNRFAWK